MRCSEKGTLNMLLGLGVALGHQLLQLSDLLLILGELRLGDEESLPWRVKPQ